MYKNKVENFFKKIKKTFKNLLTNQNIYGILYIVRERKQQTNKQNGSIAQLGEHLPYKQRVIGSSPIVPTILAR